MTVVTEQHGSFRADVRLILDRWEQISQGVGFLFQGDFSRLQPGAAVPHLAGVGRGRWHCGDACPCSKRSGQLDWESVSSFGFLKPFCLLGCL